MNVRFSLKRLSRGDGVLTARCSTSRISSPELGLSSLMMLDEGEGVEYFSRKACASAAAAPMMLGSITMRP